MILENSHIITYDIYQRIKNGWIWHFNEKHKQIYIGYIQNNIVFRFGMFLHGDGGKCFGYWNDFQVNEIGYFIGGNDFFTGLLGQ